MTMKREGLSVKYFVYIGSIDLVRRYNNTYNTVQCNRNIGQCV